MFVQTCTAKDIIELNQNKEYTLTATGILENILTNPNLNAQTVKLWQYLFNKSRFQADLDVKICYKELATKLNRSTRTISRYVKTLVKEGFLLIKQNFSYDGSQQSNTFFIRIPSNIAEQVKETKDRSKNKTYSSTNEDVSCSLSSSSDKTYSNISNSDNDISIIKECDSDIESDLISSKEDEDTVVKENTFVQINSLGNSSDKIVMGEDDKNVLQKISNKKNIINNNIVVDLVNNATSSDVLRETQQTPMSFQKLNELEEKINLLYKKMLLVSWDEKTQIMTEIKKLQAIVSTEKLIADQQKQADELLTNNSKEQSCISTINPSTDFAQIKTERELSKLDITRLTKAIKNEIDSSNQKRILNEIIFAIRFGSLKYSQKGQLLSTSHAVSISLKLLREKRWETPAPLVNKEKTVFSQKNIRIFRPSHEHQHIGHMFKSLHVASQNNKFNQRAY